MRQVGDGLRHPLERLVPDLVEHKGQQDRHREREDELERADDDRIGQRPRRRVCREELLEMLPPDPGAVPDPQPDVVVLKRDLKPVHGPIAENDDQRKPRQEHQIKRSVGLHPLQQRFLSDFVCRLSFALHGSRRHPNTSGSLFALFSLS